jgi:hypothetical protein
MTLSDVIESQSDYRLVYTYVCACTTVFIVTHEYLRVVIYETNANEKFACSSSFPQRYVDSRSKYTTISTEDLHVHDDHRFDNNDELLCSVLILL